MTNKERWNSWVVLVAGARTYLGKMLEEDPDDSENGMDGPHDNYFILQPCIHIIEQFPVMPGAGNQPVIVPVASFATIGMFSTDQLPVIVWADAYINLENASEEQLQPYTDAYDQMLKQVEQNQKIARERRSAVKIPTAEEIDRLNKGGGGETKH